MRDDFSCDALSVTQPGGTFYVAPVRASEIATVCRPLTKAVGDGLFDRDVISAIDLSKDRVDTLVRSLQSSRFRAEGVKILSEERKDPYQRLVNEERAEEIAQYLQQPSSLLPNSIIVAVDVDLDEDDVVSETKCGVRITLPRSTSSAVILDGQHRLRAFAYLNAQMQRDYHLIVTFLVGVPFYRQAELFAVINGKQKPVNRSIIFDLFGYAPVSGANEEALYEGLMAVARYCSHVTRILNRVPESPWAGCVKMRGPGDKGVISQAAVAQYLSGLVEPKALTPRLKILPVLYPLFRASDPVECATLIILYLHSVRAAIPTQWDNRKSLLWKNNGVAVLFRLLHDEIVLAGGLEPFMKKSKDVGLRWKRAPQKQLEEPPKTGGGGVQNDLYAQFRESMFTADEQQLIARRFWPMADTLRQSEGLV